MLDDTPTVLYSRMSARSAHEGAHRLGALIRARMHQLGLSLTTAAEETGLSVTTLWSLREGARDHRPRPETLLKLAIGLQLSAEDIFDALGRGDDLRAAERRHAQIYKRLDERSRVIVDAMALRLLARQAVDEEDAEPDDAPDAAATTIDLTAVRTLALPLGDATVVGAGRLRH